MPCYWRQRILLAGFSLTSFFHAAHATESIPSAASFYVPSIPELHQDPDHPLHIYAGHLEADPNADSARPEDVTAHLYFVLIKNRKVADKERVMFWFNGGPGCSSFDGLMMEVGPWRMNDRGTLDIIQGGWDEYTTMVYIDQPAGTGYSYTSTNKYVHMMDEAIRQLMVFLGNFYKVFPEYQTMDTYIGGESYAGQYIPYFADAFLNDGSLNIPLKGIAIGNGWIDARAHYASYVPFLVKMGILPEGSEEYKVAKKQTDDCLAIYDKHEAEPNHIEPISLDGCDGILTDIAAIRKKNGMCMNIYDVRLDDTYPDCGMNWPPPINNITKYLDRQDVVVALHAQAHPGSWVECKGGVHTNFRDTLFDSSIKILPSVAERIPVLIFAGDQDYICNYIGLESMIANMEWAGEKGLGKVETKNWIVDDQPAGTWVEARNLTYAKMFNASHMAPFDYPHVAHDMILRFMGVDWNLAANGTTRISSSVGHDIKPVVSLGDSVSDASSKTGSGASSNGGSGGDSPEQSKAKWEAYYNAGSSALVLIVIAAAIGIFFWWRRRRSSSSKGVRLPVNNRGSPGDDPEESVPLTTARDEEEGLPRRMPSRKGKERAMDDGSDEGNGHANGNGHAVGNEERLFDVGDDDEDEESYYGRR
ncbi:Alpha/Beta hydrolase protein [Flagelloscypha sp. PMI_526]|nr:Alpha/Beta hydrolase protein [Flagelloscypha sp. PMI_526]